MFDSHSSIEDRSVLVSGHTHFFWMFHLTTLTPVYLPFHRPVLVGSKQVEPPTSQSEGFSVSTCKETFQDRAKNRTYQSMGEREGGSRCCSVVGKSYSNFSIRDRLGLLTDNGDAIKAQLGQVALSGRRAIGLPGLQHRCFSMARISV